MKELGAYSMEVSTSSFNIVLHPTSFHCLSPSEKKKTMEDCETLVRRTNSAATCAVTGASATAAEAIATTKACSLCSSFPLLGIVSFYCNGPTIEDILLLPRFMGCCRRMIHYSNKHFYYGCSSEERAKGK
ncbi:hypothetical protein CR513_04523, partial [Mucuna pruriens]